MAYTVDEQGNIRCENPCGRWLGRVLKHGPASLELRCRECKRHHTLKLDPPKPTHLQLAGLGRRLP